ncbi:MAG TPA: type IV pilus assembly protein PilM [Elusimicrobiales bacterium]|nr:type IV pilus assembly protein PilM [Elusimicrobiales bacterium]
MLAKFTKMLFPPKEIIGIDIGNHSVKLVCFVENKKALALKDWGCIPLTIKADTPPEEKKAIISEEIKNYLKKKGIEARRAAASVSGNSVIVRYVKLPKLTSKELLLTINVEAEPFIPFDINDVRLTYSILNDVTEEGEQKMETVLVAAKKESVQDKIDILEGAGLDPVLVDVDSFALETLYSRLVPAADNSSVLFLNIGQKVTNLSIVTQGVTRVVRDIFIAGATFDKAIAKALKSDAAAAMAAKKAHGLLVTDEDKEAAIESFDKEGILVSKAASGVLKDLYTEVSRSIDFYLSQGVDHSIAKIIISGGMANLGNVSMFLASEFKVPVEVANPLAFLSEQPKNIPKDVLPALAVAAGLALRKFKDWEE